jgi:ribosomal 30S subunit maturation factor RimM
MADVWVYRVGVVVLDDGTGAVPDVTGFEVVTTDGEKIGTVDEASNEAGGSWIVVDTGFWNGGTPPRRIMHRLRAC